MERFARTPNEQHDEDAKQHRLAIEALAQESGEAVDVVRGPAEAHRRRESSQRPRTASEGLSRNAPSLRARRQQSREIQEILSCFRGPHHRHSHRCDQRQRCPERKRGFGTNSVPDRPEYERRGKRS